MGFTCPNTFVCVVQIEAGLYNCRPGASLFFNPTIRSNRITIKLSICQDLAVKAEKLQTKYKDTVLCVVASKKKLEYNKSVSGQDTHTYSLCLRIFIMFRVFV